MIRKFNILILIVWIGLYLFLILIHPIMSKTEILEDNGVADIVYEVNEDQVK